MIVLDDMTKKLQPIVTELFIGGRKLNLSVIFVTQSLSDVPSNIKLNSTLYFIIEIQNNREFQHIAIHSSDTEFKDFMNLYKKCTANSDSFLVNDTTLASDSPLPFTRNLLRKI